MKLSKTIMVVLICLYLCIYVPPVASAEETSQYDGTTAQVNSFPSYYNVYENGRLPAVRNQEPYDTCWAYGTIAAVEADLIHDGNASTDIDLSELHLVYFNYHDFYDEKGCNSGDHINPSKDDYLNTGGYLGHAAMTLANMLGPVWEDDAPYSQAASYAPDSVNGRTGVFQITGAYMMDIYDRDAVKAAILDHGAVSAAYRSDVDYYSETYNSFYYPDATSCNHVITLVGWDDEFSQDHFVRGTPEGNGAWLVRNSFGVNGYGYNGYFWISYYDKSFEQTAYAYDVQGWRYDHCYAYDNCPSTGYWYYYNCNSASQIFRVDGGEQVEAIGFYTEYPQVDLLFTLSCGDQTTAMEATVDYPGFYVFPLPESFPIRTTAEVTVDCTFINTTDSEHFFYTEYDGSYHEIIFTPSCESGGLSINDNIISYDGRVKLFTNDMSE